MDEYDNLEELYGNSQDMDLDELTKQAMLISANNRAQRNQGPDVGALISGAANGLGSLIARNYNQAPASAAQGIKTVSDLNQNRIRQQALESQAELNRLKPIIDLRKLKAAQDFKAQEAEKARAQQLSLQDLKNEGKASNNFGKGVNQLASVRKDNQTVQAGDKVHTDKIVQQYTQNLDRLQRGRAILDQPLITNQEFNDYQLELQAALTGASSGGALGKLERTEYKTAQGKLASLAQEITGNPTDAVPKGLVDRLRSLADHTKDMIAKTRYDRAQKFNVAYPNNPDATKNRKAAIESYKPDMPTKTIGGVVYEKHEDGKWYKQQQ